MIDPELLAQAERMARPCVLLVPEGPADGFAGIWGGPGVVPAPDGPYRHRLSIDCGFLPRGLGPSAGVLSVYTDEEDCESGIAVHDPAAALPGDQGVRVYARPGRSLPPPDAIPHADEEEYVRVWQSSCPIYSDQAMAVLGGWHFPWPDGDWEELRPEPLLVWTLAESEPWVEVWGVPGGFRVVQRIT